MLTLENLKEAFTDFGKEEVQLLMRQILHFFHKI